MARAIIAVRNSCMPFTSHGIIWKLIRILIVACVTSYFVLEFFYSDYKILLKIVLDLFKNSQLVTDSWPKRQFVLLNQRTYFNRIIRAVLQISHHCYPENTAKLVTDSWSKKQLVLLKPRTYFNWMIPEVLQISHHCYHENVVLCPLCH